MSLVLPAVEVPMAAANAAAASFAALEAKLDYLDPADLEQFIAECRKERPALLAAE